MIDREDEYKQAFYNIKKWVKHCSSSSFTWGYSAGNASQDDARKIFPYILSLDKKLSFEEKLKLIYRITEEENKKKKIGFISSFYRQIMDWINKDIDTIEKGEHIKKFYLTKR